MQKHCLLAVWACLVCAALASAQTALPPPSLLPPSSPVEAATPSILPFNLPMNNLPVSQLWFQAEYLVWQMHAPVSVPIVTTGDPNAGAQAGAIGQPGTQLLFGNGDVNYSFMPGMRFAMGDWIDREHVFGLETSVLYFQPKSAVYRTASDASGNPPIYLSAYNSVTGREDSGIVAETTSQFSGNASVTTDFRLWGAEMNGLVLLFNTPTMEWYLLTGLRYVNLQESLQVDTYSTDLVVGTVTTTQDRFETTNRFLGGQLGLRYRWQPGLLSYELTGKLAVGANNQTVNIQGESTQFGGPLVAPITTPGGFYAQPTNIGAASRVQLALAPSLDMKVDFQFTPHIHGFVSYGLLAVTEVVRPGNQIDRDLNLTKSPIFGVGAVSNIPAPGPQFNHSTLFADGISIGLEFRY